MKITVKQLKNLVESVVKETLGSHDEVEQYKKLFPDFVKDVAEMDKGQLATTYSDISKEYYGSRREAPEDLTPEQVIELAAMSYFDEDE